MIRKDHDSDDECTSSRSGHVWPEGSRTFFHDDSIVDEAASLNTQCRSFYSLTERWSSDILHKVLVKESFDSTDENI